MKILEIEYAKGIYPEIQEKNIISEKKNKKGRRKEV